jgi:hypothetical protein
MQKRRPFRAYCYVIWSFTGCEKKDCRDKFAYPNNRIVIMFLKTRLYEINKFSSVCDNTFLYWNKKLQ